MTGIPMPELQSANAWIVSGLAGGFGIILVLWGGKLHRLAVGAAGALVGLVLGQFAARAFAIDPMVAQAIGAGAIGLIGLLAARSVWVVLATIMAMIATAWLLAVKYGQVAEAGDTAAVLDAVRAVAKRFYDDPAGFWDRRAIFIGLSLLAAASAPVAVGMLRPKLMGILMTSLIGSVAIVFAFLLGAAQLDAALWDRGLSNCFGLGVLTTALMFGGLLCQFRRTGSEDDETSADSGGSSESDSGSSHRASGGKNSRNKKSISAKSGGSYSSPRSGGG